MTVRTAVSVAVAAGALAAGSLAVLPATANAATVSSPACSNSSLLVTHTPVGGATGHASATLLFRNVSNHSCTLSGYPGLDAINAHGQVLKHARRDLNGFAGGAHAMKRVTLQPGHTASAVLEWIDLSTHQWGPLHFSAASAVTAPNTTRTVVLPLRLGLPDLQVHPVVGGTSGNYEFVRAQSLWLAGARSDAADMGSYWTRAAHYLRDEYTTQASELQRLAALPNTSLTSAQQASARHLTGALNAFFGTPHLYS